MRPRLQPALLATSGRTMQGFRIADAVRRLWSGERDFGRLVAGLNLNEQSLSLVHLLLTAQEESHEEDDGSPSASTGPPVFTHCVFVTNLCSLPPAELAGCTVDVVAQTVVDESHLASATTRQWNTRGWNSEKEFRAEYCASMERVGRGLCARSLVCPPTPRAPAACDSHRRLCACARCASACVGVCESARVCV